MTTGHYDDDGEVPFAVWRKDGSEADALPYRALSPALAAQARARQEWRDGETGWPISYCARDGVTGRIWVVDVATAMTPSFVAIDVREVEMPAAVHVLWGGRALCEDLRLRGVPRDWPADQRWISLADVAEGLVVPKDHCETCWKKAPGLVEGLRQIGKDR